MLLPKVITIFTPTYNRSHLLLRLYESLCKQSHKEFEWLIVDDGSTDNTKAVVDGFIAEDKIINILTPTIILATLVDSFTPLISKSVKTKTITTAGKLTATGILSNMNGILS